MHAIQKMNFYTVTTYQRNKMTPEQERLLKRLELKINAFLEKDTRHWLKVGAIQEVTGWTSKELRNARDTGKVITRNIGNGLEYCLESIPEIYLKKKSA